MVADHRSSVARLYFDEDADARLARALQRRGYDVETAVDADLLEASDDEQLAHAASHRRSSMIISESGLPVTSIGVQGRSQCQGPA